VLGPDPWQVVWNGTRTGFSAFLEGRHAILGWRSPVATAAERPGLVRELVEYSRALKKPLFVVLVDEATCSDALELGLHATWAGTESFIDLSQWSTAGGRRQKVRWAKSHAARLGYEWREVFPQRDHRDARQLGLVESAWKSERRERRTDSFQRTSFVELSELRRYFAAFDRGAMTAFCACTPMSATSWYLQDVVRKPGTPRGSLEGAMSLALDTLRDDGFTIASNGPIPFWQPDGAQADEHSLGPIGRGVVRFFDRQYRFGGISQFRNKFMADSLAPLYVLRSHKTIGPLAARSLVGLLTTRHGAMSGTV